MKKEKISANRLFNFASDPTCPVCGSTECVVVGKTRNNFNTHDYHELVEMFCEKCKHRWTLRFQATLVGYQPGDVFDEETHTMKEQPEKRVTK